MRPHLHVHRRRHQYRGGGGEEDRGREVVGKAGRHLRQEVGGRRSHDHQVGIACQPNVPHLALIGEREQVLVDLLAGERGQSQRRDHLAPAGGEDGTHACAPFAQPADEVETLVGGDAAGHDQEDAGGFSHGHYGQAWCGPAERVGQAPTRGTMTAGPVATTEA